MTVATRLTLEEFLSQPETEPASEFVCGEVQEKPMGTRAHKAVQHLLSVMFALYLRAHPIGEVGPEWRFVFGRQGRERSYLPDFAFVAAERVAGDDYDGPHLGPPDLAVEVLSPDDRPTRVAEKLYFYLLHGVRLIWVMEPRDQSVLVLAPGEEPRTLSSADTLTGGDLLPGFSVLVSDLFPKRGS